MVLKVCILGSGSSGNCTYIGTETTTLLIDAGLSAKEIGRRLESIGATLAGVQAVCVSHEHDDHTSALSVLHRRHGVALYANAGTVEGLRQNPKKSELPWRIFTNGERFQVGDVAVEPFSVPHDAYDPVGFILSHQGVKIGLVTDIGMVTSLVRERLKGCALLVLEANHDEDMLQQAARPWHLKQRILGRQGHLSNESAAETLVEVAGPELQQVFLAHLSRDCNRHDLALQTTKKRLEKAGLHHIKVNLTFPDRVSELWMA